MDLGLRNKIAIVTGGSRGIGQSCALALPVKERGSALRPAAGTFWTRSLKKSMRSAAKDMLLPPI